jgi:hypothetical protein
MTPVIKEFMYWWGDKLDYGTINIQSLIAKKKKNNFFNHIRKFR